MPINQGEFNYNVNFEQDKEPENLGPMITNIPFSLEQPREQLTKLHEETFNPWSSWLCKLRSYLDMSLWFFIDLLIDLTDKEQIHTHTP